MKRARKTKGSDSLCSGRCIRQREEQSNGISINDLPDHLLLEILGRLGCPTVANRCKSVCNLWYSLISSPDFRTDPGFALIVNIPTLGQPHYASETSDLRYWRGFKLQYLPRFDGLDPLRVHASYKDLLLCTKWVMSQQKFFIVNPLTMHWIDLPVSLYFTRHVRVPVGLAVGLAVKECPDEPVGYKFRVVRMILPDNASDHFWAEVFDPNINHWIQVRVNQPYHLRWRPTVYQGVVYKGVLHWLAENSNGVVVAYDPFAPFDTNGRHSCRFIKLSDGMWYDGDVNMAITECITVSEEHIRIIQLVTSLKMLKQRKGACYLTVWKLENYEEGKWVLERRVYFKDMILNSFPRPLSCHPNNSRIVYLCFRGRIVSCNLSTKVLKVVSRINEKAKHSKVDLAVPFLISSQPTAIPRY